MLRSKAGAIVRQNIQRMLADLMREGCRKKFLRHRRTDSEIPFELMVHFLASTFMSVMAWWLNQANPLPPKRIDGFFRALILPGLASNLNLMDHPHVHCVVPGGGLSPDGSRWVSSRKEFFIHVKVMSKLFKEMFRAYLKRSYESGELLFPDVIGGL